MGSGYDINLFKLIQSITKLPIIFAGGVGDANHFKEGIENNINAVAAGNIFHYTENSYYEMIKYLYDNDCNTRAPILNFY